MTNQQVNHHCSGSKNRFAPGVTITVNANRAAVAALVALSLALTVAGCDDGGEGGAAAASPSPSSASPTERVESMTGMILLKKSREAFGKVSSVTMTGFTVEDGVKSTVKVSADRQGNCTGTLDIEGKGGLELLRGSGTLLVKMSAQLLTTTHDAATAELYKGRYFRIAPGSEYAGMAEVCDLATVPGVGGEASGWDAQSGEPGTIGSRRAMSVLVVSKEEGPHTIHVPVEGPLLPLRIEAGWTGTGSEAVDEAIDFSDYDVPVTVTVPPADQILDLDLFAKPAA
ncbi:hypothetical protein [Kitasatospora sp. NPDC008115]|uniref:hypothetical protein n=1 Tax=Kitasatospora sp. NPDC008115 TaxID=3364022 RepID=UPI0036E83262